MNKNSPKLLFIDDDIGILKAHKRILEKNFEVDCVGNSDKAVELLSTKNYAVAIIDMDMDNDKEAGLKIVRHIKENNLDVKPIIYTAYGSLENAQKAIGEEVFAYVVKGQKNDPENDISKVSLRAAGIFEKETFKGLRVKRISSKKSTAANKAHTLEKVYNTPIRNLSYKLRSSLSGFDFNAITMSHIIESFIDLWSNHQSTEYYDNEAEVYSIESFNWGEFEADILNFSQYFFYLCINDLYDHHCQKELLEHLPEGYMSIEDVWDGYLTRNDFFDIDIKTTFREGASNDPLILGIRPNFRMILLNFLKNAIESMNFYKEGKNLGTKDALSIEFIVEQKETSTEISIVSNGEPFEKKQEIRTRFILESGQEGALNPDNEEIKDLLSRKYLTTKSGTGTGYGLVEAAFYFSKIFIENQGEIARGYIRLNEPTPERSKNEKQTRFDIVLPYGSNTVDKMDGGDMDDMDDCDVMFDWNLYKTGHASYPKKDFSEDYERKDKEPHRIQVPIEIQHEEKKDILVVEDSSPDRLRLRFLLDDLKGPESYTFAWNAKYKEVLHIEDIIKYLQFGRYKILLLDMAWNPYEEMVMESLLFKTCEELDGTKNTDSQYDPSTIGGIKLLKEIAERYSDGSKTSNGHSNELQLEKIVILSQFILPSAYGFRKYVRNLIPYFDKKIKIYFITKWREQGKFERLLIG